MPLPSFRSSRSKVRRRRSHHALKPIVASICTACQTINHPHRACSTCGKYGDRSVKSTSMKEVEKVLAKATKTTKHRIAHDLPNSDLPAGNELKAPATPVVAVRSPRRSTPRSK
ncbi:MAG: 50S ribosomal protein L32 [Patescibacteria group bacterium]